jgi:hypothetical protein
MKTIQPIQLWSDGKIQNAVYFNMYISYDNLSTTAVFYYSLMGETFDLLASGKIEMTGSDYQNWDDSNEGAYLYAAYVLNLVITGDAVTTASDIPSDEQTT